MKHQEKSHLLVDMWSSNLFDKLLPEIRKREDSPSIINENNDSYDSRLNQEIKLSTIGPILWLEESQQYFIKNTSDSDKTSNSINMIPLNGASDDINVINSCESSDLKDTKEDENLIIPEIKVDPIKVESPNNSRRRQSRTPTIGKVSASELFYELTRTKNLGQHCLISPYTYGEAIGPAPNEKQPFTIIAHPQVGLVCDIHGHLSEAEVIGLLAGRFDEEKNILYIQAPFPCTATERLEDDGSTDVELDPEAEWKVREKIETLGMQVVGWYHSHPTFKPDPSVTDLFNQQQYQQLMRRETTGVEPFVGLIVSTYDPNLMSNESHHQWFHVKAFTDNSAHSKGVAHLPLLLEVNYSSIAIDELEIDKYLLNAENLQSIFESTLYSDVEDVEESKPPPLVLTIEEDDGNIESNSIVVVKETDQTIELIESSEEDLKNDNHLGNDVNNNGNITNHDNNNKEDIKLESMTTNEISPPEVNQPEETIEKTESQIIKEEIVEQIKSEDVNIEVIASSPQKKTPEVKPETVTKRTSKSTKKRHGFKDSLVSIGNNSNLNKNSKADETNIETVEKIDIPLPIVDQTEVPVVIENPESSKPTDEVVSSEKNAIIINSDSNSRPRREGKKRDMYDDSKYPKSSKRRKKETIPEDKIEEIEKINSNNNNNNNNNNNHNNSNNNKLKIDEKEVIQASGKNKLTKTNITKKGPKRSLNNNSIIKAESKKSKNSKSVNEKKQEKTVLTKTKVVIKNKNTIFSSIILSLKNKTYESSRSGCLILFSMIPEFRCLALSIVSLGFYYSRSSNRVELSRRWKGNLSKLDKLIISTMVWAKKLGLLTKKINSDKTTRSSSSENYLFLIHLKDFLSKCWDDYGKKKRNNNNN